MNTTIKITRTTNGWILEEPQQYDDGTEYVSTSVFEDKENMSSYDDRVEQAESLMNLMQVAFGSDCGQSKKQGGFVISVEREGYGQND